MSARASRAFDLLLVLLLLALIALGILFAWRYSQPGEPSLPPLEEFVRRSYVHGVPFEQASAYPKSEVPRLLAMLDDPAERSYWPAIVTTVCMIGDSSAVDALVAFIEEPVADRLTQSHYEAKTAALIGLGYIENKSRDTRALDYLARSINPDKWTDDRIRWQSPLGEKPEVVRRHLARLSILGLGLAGTGPAEGVLRSAAKDWEREDSDVPLEFRKLARPVLEQSIATNLEIRQKGLKRYYSDGKH